MSTEADKAIVLRLMEEYFNNQNEAVWDELAHPEVVIHGVSTLHGASEAKAFFARLHESLQPWHVTVEDVIAEGDKVVVRLTESGTMVGPWLGRAPTGKSFQLGAVQICRLAGGRLVEMWGFRDTGSMMRQLGLA